ncbi:hypothetical protein BOX15_Mlig004478g1, partial [Macrostomum lignano]
AKKARRKMQLFARRHGMPALANVSWYSLLFAERTSGQKGKKRFAGQAQPTVQRRSASACASEPPR